MARHRGFGIYVHWPFCLAKCPYCDFNSHVRDRIDQPRWRDALVQQLDRFAAQTRGRRVTSVFFGGGTPSLMTPSTVAAVVQRIDRHWSLSPDAEVTLEANPTSVESGKFQGFKAAGVNRLSLGVQALDDPSLAFLGRNHSAAEALEAVALARRHFERFSFDLIYARPGQSLTAWRDELSRALGEGATHLSLYQLTIEQGTAFHAAHRRGELPMPDATHTADLYDTTQDVMSAAGLPAYEISNHARNGAESRHNLTYWRYGDYLGIGPGAHGRLSHEGRKFAIRQHRAPEVWLDAVERADPEVGTRSELTRDQRLLELTMMGLRLTQGIDRSAFREELGMEPEDAFSKARLDRLVEAGFLELNQAALRATPAGRRRLDAVLDYLVNPATASL